MCRFKSHVKNCCDNFVGVSKGNWYFEVRKIKNYFPYIYDRVTLRIRYYSTYMLCL